MGGSTIHLSEVVTKFCIGQAPPVAKRKTAHGVTFDIENRHWYPARASQAHSPPSVSARPGGLHRPGRSEVFLQSHLVGEKSHN